jgi:hypothetical protein
MNGPGGQRKPEIRQAKCYSGIHFLHRHQLILRGSDRRITYSAETGDRVVTMRDVGLSAKLRQGLAKRSLVATTPQVSRNYEDWLLFYL